jgi:uncharacterized protein YkwD
MDNFSLPTLRGNWVDLVVIILTLFYLWGGWGRGFLLGFIDLGGFLLSFVSALKLYSYVGELLVLNFQISPGIANAAGFLLVGLLTEVVFSLVMSFTYKKLYRKFFINLANLERKKITPLLLYLDKIFSFIPALGEAIIFTAFLLTLLISLPVQGNIKKDIISAKLGGPLVVRTQKFEGTLNKIFGEAVSETLTFLTVNPDPSSGERVDLRFTQAEVKEDEIAEEAMLNLINLEREKAGLEKLSLSKELRQLARNYARDMFARGFFSHYNLEEQSPFERMTEEGIQFYAAGENLALAPNVELAHQGLMNSPGHRANILSSDFGKVGIGVIDGGIYGEMIVQEFTN